MVTNNDILKIALVQSQLHWESPVNNRKMFSAKIEQIKEYVDVIVLPEMFTTGFTMNPEHVESKEGNLTVSWMKDIASKKNCAIIGSMVFSDNDAYFNRLFFIKPEGETFFYDKRHTFTLAGEDKKYTAGTQRLIVNYKGFNFCPLICYDLRFPVWSRNTENIDILLYVANWPAPRINAWDALLKARAIENMVYCIGVNRIGTDNEGHEYPGHSALYDPLGNVLALSKVEEVVLLEVHKNEIHNVRNKLRFLEDRDHFVVM
jgi:omega-amidase